MGLGKHQLNLMSFFRLEVRDREEEREMDFLE